jgi:hypothetical protein
MSHQIMSGGPIIAKEIGMRTNCEECCLRGKCGELDRSFRKECKEEQERLWEGRLTKIKAGYAKMMFYGNVEKMKEEVQRLKNRKAEVVAEQEPLFQELQILEDLHREIEDAQTELDYELNHLGMVEWKLSDIRG